MEQFHSFFVHLIDWLGCEIRNLLLWNDSFSIVLRDCSLPGIIHFEYIYLFAIKYWFRCPIPHKHSLSGPLAIAFFNRIAVSRNLSKCQFYFRIPFVSYYYCLINFRVQKNNPRGWRWSGTSFVKYDNDELRRGPNADTFCHAMKFHRLLIGRESIERVWCHASQNKKATLSGE